MANNSKFDAQLERMQYLMGYDGKINESKKKSNLAYKAVGADDKVYGIIKEGNIYYIKTTEQGKENLIESYDYINGYNYRNENGYKSYNEATKQLELKLMSLNEAYGKKNLVSTFDSDKNKKAFTELTEAARKELNRLNQIMENSQVIGPKNVLDVETKGKAGNPTEQGEPFEEKATAELDKDFETKATPQDAADLKTVTNVEKDLQSDKMKTTKVCPAEDMCETHDDIEGEGVADKNPKGAKKVAMNEGIEDFDDEVVDGEDELVGDDEDLDDLLNEFLDANVSTGDINASIPMPLEEEDDVEGVEEVEECVCKCGKKGCKCKSKEGDVLKETINQIVNEELLKQSEFGKHPSYKKPFMSVSKKGVKDDEPYGKKIGNSKPYDLLVDEIYDALKTKLDSSKKA